MHSYAYQIAASKTVVEIDRPLYKHKPYIKKPFRITKGNYSHRIGP